jgi:microcystin degradation protein MlrC
MAKVLRIGVAGITQESNTFAPRQSPLEDFSIEVGDPVVASSRGTNTEVGGFLQELEENAVQVLPLISAWAVSAGPVEDEAFEHLVSLLIKKLAEVKLDGLLLALHGAWLSASYPSADAELLRRIRHAVGPALPIVVTLDSHANVSPALLTEVQGLVGYRTYPHVDMGDAGRKAARVLMEIITRGISPQLYLLGIPLLAPPQRATTDQPPIQDVLARLDRELPAELIMSSSLFYVQPWLDIEHVQSSLVVVARAPSPEIASTMMSLAKELWDRRADFHVEWTQPEMLVPEVLKEGKRPTIVSEAFDGTSGGAPGDNPGLLATLLPHANTLSACLFVVDPAAAQLAENLGLDAEFSGPLGALSDRRFGLPLEIKARVRNLSDGCFVLKGPVFTGRKVCMGLTAVLEVGRMTIVVGSRAVFAIDPELYRSQGIEPSEQDLVAVKSPTLFRPGYASMLNRVIHLDMAGVSRGNLNKVPFEHIGRPIYPLDDFPWEESPHPLFRHGPGTEASAGVV